VLVVGGAGSIGGATVHAIAARAPSQLTVVDISENYLAELVRDLRSSGQLAGRTDLGTHVFDYGSAIMQRFLRDAGPFDAVLNFAAVKHVRAERDVHSLLHMLDVNVLKQARFKRWLAASGNRGRYFTVSTDKAANPSSLMGASKRLMEDVAMDVVRGHFAATTSARFANVAISNGSLLQGFLARIDKRQPLSVPRDTRRYFVSHAESADLCLLAAFAAPDGLLLVPALDPAKHLVLLQEVAARVLASFGYEPLFVDNPAAARAAMQHVVPGRRWPVLVTPLDTAGEKPYEEFVAEGEVLEDPGYAALRGIRHVPSVALDAVLSALERVVGDPASVADKADIVEILQAAVPAMRHRETGLNLDARM
jgi:FlaA1/EpsC-like NDP-sugar epimerase